MIKNVIYVEDGSVDVDELQESLGDETKVIVYRQGAKAPEILQLREPLNTVFDDEFIKIRKRIESTRRLFSEFMKMKSTKKVQNKVREIYSILFEGIDF